MKEQKVICLSWPRFRGSFIQRRFTNGKLEAKTFVSCREGGNPYATWDFNPSKKKDDFKDFYDTDPILAKARYECDPPYARDAYIKDSLPVLRAFDAEIDEVGQIFWGVTESKNLVDIINQFDAAYDPLFKTCCGLPCLSIPWRDSCQ